RPERARSMTLSVSEVSPGPRSSCARRTSTRRSDESAPSAMRSPAPFVRAYSPRANSGEAGSDRSPMIESPVWATDGEEMWTRRGTPAARAVAPRVRVPPMFAASMSFGAPISDTLAARCPTAAAPSAARPTVAASVTGAQAIGGMLDPGGPALQSRDLVPGRDEGARDGRTEQPGGSGDGDSHFGSSDSCSHRPAGQDTVGPDREPGAVDLRIVADVGGELRGDEHRSEVEAGLSRLLTQSGGQLQGCQPGGERRPLGVEHGHQGLSPDGADADDGAAADLGVGIDERLEAAGAHRAGGGRDHVLQSALEPDATGIVDVADVVRPVPVQALEAVASGIGGGPPQVVVAGFDVGGADDELAQSA